MNEDLQRAIKARNDTQTAIDVIREIRNNHRPLSRADRAAISAVFGLLQSWLTRKQREIEDAKVNDPIYWS